MTVAELRAELAQYPDYAEVAIRYAFEGHPRSYYEPSPVRRHGGSTVLLHMGKHIDGLWGEETPDAH